MAQEVEISTLDLRYQDYRMRNSAQEQQLLSSISKRGVEEPLEGVSMDEAHILLNGFKRYRCAHKLGIERVPFALLGEDEAMGIMSLLRISNTKSLSILEQASFIDELAHVHQMKVAEIACELSRSKSWVSMRLGLIEEMSERIRQKLFGGAFPVYPYMYTVRQFMRMNSVSQKQVEEFVVALSGKKLSVREIEQLANGYFSGPESFREEIRKGNVALALSKLRGMADDPEGCNKFERVLLKDLELVGRYMQRVMGKSNNKRLTNRAFHAQAHLLTAGILSRAPAFTETMRRLHDRCGEA